ncbi:hypothetical protein [Lunatibacter salilacus]|uniref:hypothetical protein n=1 Tax=Lunatibacter salilacus TaxID=2483804 RepID=UPI00131E6A43|nr:hypothetical protein [Lunatibacter salilacus]
MKRYFTNSFKSNLARIFLFLAIVKGIDFGLLNVDFFCTGDLPWKPNTEYFQETELFKDIHIPNFDVFDVAGLDKTPIPHPGISGVFLNKHRFFVYNQKLANQENLSFSSIAFFLVTSKSNIPHLNLDDEDHLAFSLM